MSNDCGCTKKVVDKIYVESSCCNKKEKTTNNCKGSCCSSCGKQIDLIDSDLYAENIYNYTPNTTFNTEQVLLKESDLLDSINNPSTREDVYSILLETNNVTEVVVQLKTSYTGHFGLKCIATLREDEGKYTLVYTRQFRDETLTDNDPKRIKTVVYVYTNDFEEVTFKDYDITTYTFEEINNLLNLYVTESQVENYVTNFLSLYYYDKTYIDDLHLGEDCLFEEYTTNQVTNLGSTIRKGHGGIASGSNSFSMQGAEATGDNSIAFLSGTKVSGNNSLGLSGSEVESPNSVGAILSKIKSDSQNSVALNNGTIIKSPGSIALMNGTIINSPYSVSIGSSSLSKNETDTSKQSEFSRLNIDKYGDVLCNVSMYGGFASGRNSIAIGSYEKTTDQNKNNYCSATNRNSISIGAKVFNSGFFATALGYDVEIGRYRVYRGNTLVYEYGDSEEKRGKFSTAFGTLISVAGPCNIVAGERHFIKGGNNAVFGNGNVISNSINVNNLIFGTRCRIENADTSLSGGYYSSIIKNGEGNTSHGAISLGDTLRIDNLYLYDTNTHTTDDDKLEIFKLYYKHTDSNNNTVYLEVLLNSELGKAIELSNISLRNGSTKYLGSFSFLNLKNNATPIYPGIESLMKDGNSYKVTLSGVKESTLGGSYDKNSDGYFSCSVRFSGFSNKVYYSGGVSLGTGNEVLSNRGIAIGTGNVINSEGGITIGNFNSNIPQIPPLSSQQLLSNGINDVVFSIGDGYYNSSDLTIHRRNVVEIIRGNNKTIEDIHFVIGDKWYSMSELLAALERLGAPLTVHNVNDQVVQLTNVSSNNPNIGGSPLQYINISESIVYDPNRVLHQDLGESDG